MKIVNFESVSDATGNYLIYNAGNEMSFDRIGVRMLLSDLPPFLAPVKIMNKYGSCVIEYGTGGHRSIDSLKMRMSKKECCTLLYNMLSPMMSCGEWLLDYHRFCWQKDYILCSAGGFDVKFLYIPDNDHYCSDSEITDVFRSIFRGTDITDDKDFRIDLLQTLLDENFSVSGLYGMISGIIKRPETAVPQTVRKAPAQAAPERPEAAASLPREERSRPKAPKLPEAPSVDLRDDDEDFDMSNLFSGGKKAPKQKKEKAPKEKSKQKPERSGNIFGKGKPRKEAPAQALSGRGNDETVIAGMDRDETQIVTAFLRLESTELKNCPDVINLTINEGGSLTIGRKSANQAAVNADVEFSSDCATISRTHCRVRLEDGVYSVCDLNSGNGTFVDGKRSEPGVWTELHSGSRLMFGNNVAVYVMRING